MPHTVSINYAEAPWVGRLPHSTNYVVPKPTGATWKITGDFALFLATGETLSNPTVSVDVLYNDDASTTGMVATAASVSGTTVVQLVAAGTADSVYVLWFQADSSDGQVLREPCLLAVSNKRRWGIAA